MTTRQGCCVDYATTPAGYCEGERADECMRLPSGKTCGDCQYLRRCVSIGYTPSADKRVCSFHPRRFLETR